MLKKAFCFFMTGLFIFVCWSEVLAQSQITVPNVLQMDAAVGIAALEKAGFAPGNIRITYLRSASQKDLNKITKQSMSAGQKVPANSTISLLVLRSQVSQVAVPNVLGSGQEQANQIIESAELKTTINFVQTRTPKEFGKVLSQKPAAGQTASRGDIIVLGIGKPDLSSVPKVDGLSVEQASQNLWNAGYKVRILPDSVSTLDPARDGRVSSQEPPVGADWTVTLKLYKFTGAPVPKVVGMTYEQANQTFIKAGLATSKGDPSIITTDRKQHGTVARQSVEPGKYLARGTAVILQLYSYNAPVPAVIGMTNERATQTLQTMGFIAVSDFEGSQNAKEFFKVIRQKPAAGQMASKGDRITLSIGKPEFSSVPKVAGLPVEQARQTLEKAGYKVQVSQNFVATSDLAQDGRVNSQDTPAGPEWTVTLKLYKITGIKVPNVVGMPYEQAMQILGNGGLAVHEADSKEITHDPKQHGRVASQNYEPGKYLAPRTVVYLKVYDLQILVPNVVGMTLAQAQQAIKQVDLESVTKEYQFQRVKDKNLHGKVATQAPTAGQKTVKGSPVFLTLYNALPPIPSVIGADYEKARNMLEQAGYRAVRAKEEIPTKDGMWSGKVASQNPNYGEVRMGGDVMLTLYASLPQAVLPNVIGLSYDQAKQVLLKAGFDNVSTGRTLVDDPKLAAGIIETQDPPAGRKIFTTERVLITGKRYEKRDSVKVPNVLNMTDVEAGKTLQNAGLFYGIGYKETSRQELAGRIMSQDPSPGTSVFAQSSVQLTAGRFSAAAIDVNMKFVKDNKTYLLAIKGGAQPYDVKADYNVPADDQKKLGGAKALEILGLKDEPSSPEWKYYRVIAKIPMKATFTIKDTKGTTKQFIATMENK